MTLTQLRPDQAEAECVGALTNRGFNMTTYSGKPFWPFDPRPEDFRIFDIAHSLANICRFNGHTKEFYSVAQHCVHGSYEIERAFAFEFLMHEVEEAYTGDMIRPIKYLPTMTGFRNIQNKIDAVSRRKFGLPEKMSPEVKIADNRMCWTEKRDLLLNQQDIDWGTPIEPYERRIKAISPLEAKWAFIDRFKELLGPIAPEFF